MNIYCLDVFAKKGVYEVFVKHGCKIRVTKCSDVYRVESSDGSYVGMFHKHVELDYVTGYLKGFFYCRQIYAK